MTRTQKIQTLIPNGADQLYTVCYPNPGKETIILLHGGPGTPDDFLWFLAEFEQDFQIINFHQRGTKQSPCPSGDFSIEAYIADIDTIANHFKVDKFHLLGHSWGGLYAQIYASKHPERLLSLFLSSPGTGTGKEWKIMEKEMMTYNKNHCSRLDWIKMGIFSLLGNLGSSKASQALFRQVARNYNADYPAFRDRTFDMSNVSVQAGNRTRKAIMAYPPLAPLENPSFPITVTFGDNDIFGDSKRFIEKRYPSAQIFFIKNSGHFPFFQNPDHYFAILQQHFKN
ncbi:alpha/beta fold hydrolase [Streptococcus oricebi]|uniref:Alpha/beta hydrolase n=1 Tax=Streptococcus oricebi TaxID=1547447 RepID=A0ABS5B2M4_9STRE|nr:alpha/beta hydrolase [Streptococcus oricebi]MBP2622728.1 alpha/beta hydrolase [Streptococcus oricebi]